MPGRVSRWPAGRTALYLAGDGRASADECSGRLLDAALADAGVDCLVHDPWRPAPSVGGAFGNPPGPADRSAIDARGDVVTFTTTPFTQELRLAGEVAAELWLHCDRPSFDLYGQSPRAIALRLNAEYIAGLHGHQPSTETGGAAPAFSTTSSTLASSSGTDRESSRRG